MPDSNDEHLSPHQAKQHFIKYIRNELFTLNFYRAHMLYFIVVIAISSVIVYGEGVKNGPKDGYYDSHLSYMDALFLTCSAMTTTGTSVLPSARSKILYLHSGDVNEIYGTTARSGLQQDRQIDDPIHSNIRL
jgi:hypothetical protein